jgi:hypothetical protein
MLFFYCNRNAQGFIAMAESLAHNDTLKSLNMWRVGGGSYGGSVLAKNIVLNKSILFCDVSHNNMDMKDVVTIANHLDSNLAAFEQDERHRRRDDAAEEKVQQDFEDKRNVSEVLYLIHT